MAVALVTGAASIAALVPLLGTSFGSVNRVLEMAGAAQFQLALLSVPLFLCAALLRSRAALAASLAAVLVTWSGVVPWYLGKDATGGGEETLRLLSFNVLHGNREFQKTIDLIHRERPQIAVFQEATPPWPDELAELAEILPHRHRAAELQMEIFSELPLEQLGLTVVGKNRGFVELGFEIEGQPAVLIATHCYPQRHFGEQGFRWRNEHLGQLLPEAVRRHTDRLVIVAGDLNATMWSHAYRQLVKTADLRNTRRGFGVHPTCGWSFRAMRLLAIPIDHCLVGEGWIVHDFRSGPDIGSDHLPILCDLSLRRPS